MKPIRLLISALAVIMSLLIITNSGFAQCKSEFHSNEINATLNCTGDLFWDHTTGDPGFEVPFTVTPGTKKHCSSAAGLWIGGQDLFGRLLMAATTYRTHGADFYAGILSSSATTNSAVETAFSNIWYIDQDSIDYHKANFMTPGYVPPSHITNYPWKGTDSDGMTALLAPFVDVDGDPLTYNPLGGDYPCIKGDKAAFMFFNDKGDLHSLSQGEAIGLEVQLMVYGYDDPRLAETLFLEYTLTNKSSLAINETYIGFWQDFDIGNPSDDFIGSDSTLNLFYAYNGDTDDDTTFGGYGSNPPALGVCFLNQPLERFISYSSDSSAATGTPTIPTEYYQYLQSKWKDGTPLVNNGLNGHQATGSGPSSGFLYNDYTGPCTSPSGWTESSASSIPGNRNGLGSFAQGTIMPGSQTTFELAIIHARGYYNDNLGSVCELKETAKYIRDTFYTSLGPCGEIITGKESPSQGEVIVYPNPASDHITIESKDPSVRISSVRITDLTGKLIREEPLNHTNIVELDLNSFTKGTYLISLYTNKGVLYKKLIRQ